MNGIEIPVSPGRFRADLQHVAVLDSGSPIVYLPTQEFDAVVKAFKGNISTEPDDQGAKVFFECIEPQLLEVKLHGRWFAIDPLDLLKPQSRHVMDERIM